MIYELAVKTPANRQILKTEEELSDYIERNGNDTDMYMSVYCYAEEDRTGMENTKVQNWFFPRYIQWVPIDIDKGQNAPKKCIRDAIHILYQLEELGLRRHNYKLYFSGRGFHIYIHADCFNFPVSDDLPYMVKQTISKLPFGKLIDPAIYHRNAVIRCTYTYNSKGKRYKIPITREELYADDYDAISSLALTRRLDFNWEEEYSGEGELNNFVCNHNNGAVKRYSNIVERHNYACIHKLLEQGAVEGTRNNSILRIAGHLSYCDIPCDIAVKMLLDWNNHSLEDQIVIEKVEKAYQRGYHYGCDDSILKACCSIRCRRYRKKDYISTPMSKEEIFHSAKSINFAELKANGIDYARLFGISGFNFTVIPGELVALLGITKCGKSTLMKHIALALDMTDTSSIYPQYRRETLYYTSEQSPEYFLLICCQILENCSEQETLLRQNDLLDKWYPHYKHIIPIGKTDGISGLEENIVRFQPEQVIIDTLDHFADNEYGEHIGIKMTMVQLQELCAKYHLIIYVVSQVSRLDARDNKVTLFSGKGSGSIENQSRKVLGLSNTTEPSIIRLEFLANAYGHIGKGIELQRYESTRLKKIRTV